MILNLGKTRLKGRCQIDPEFMVEVINFHNAKRQQNQSLIKAILTEKELTIYTNILKQAANLIKQLHFSKAQKFKITKKGQRFP